MHDIQTAVQIIRSNRYLSLGTCDPSGPWVSPLAYTLEPDGSLLFYSATQSRHALAIGISPHVAGAIFDSTASSDTATGVQFSALATVVDGPSLFESMERYFQLSFPDPETRSRWARPVEDFAGNAPQRFYRLALQTISVPDPTSLKIDLRLDLDVMEIVRSLSQSRRGNGS